MPDHLPHLGPAVHHFAIAKPMRIPTLMLVEDSRYASEVLRLYARALGLRLRRAPDLHSASAHLRLYRPDIVLVDLGLPDGRGEGLVAELASAKHRPPLIMATSGQSHLRADALAAGADVFIEKPMPDIAHFRAMLVDHFPGPLPLLLLPDQPPRPRPDRIALKDDLDFAAKSLSLVQADDDGNDLRLTAARTRYVAGLLDGVAGSLGDDALQNAARAQLACGPTAGYDMNSDVQGPISVQHSFRALRDLVNDRLRDVMTERGL